MVCLWNPAVKKVFKKNSAGRPARAHSRFHRQPPTNAPAEAGRWSGALALMVLCAGSLLISGCRTGPALAPVDLQHPGWTVQRGQAVWQPKTDAPELAGQLLMASNESGEQLIRFSKDPMEIVLARRTDPGWSLVIGAFDKSYSGRGRPPRRIGWFQLADAVFQDNPANGWIWSGINERRWELTHPKTGERLEGFFRE